MSDHIGPQWQHTEFQKKLDSVSKPISRVAVCLYGCYRTGDYCLPYHLDFFKSPNVTFDFFGVTKNVDEYTVDNHLRNQGIKKINNPYISVKNILGERLKGFKIVDEEKEKTHNINRSFIFSQIYESVLLKSDFELKYNFKYDLVWVVRWDIVFRNLKFIDEFIQKLNSETLNEKLKQGYGVLDRRCFVDTLGISKWFNPIVPGFQDLFLCANSANIDMLSDEFLNFTKYPDWTSSDFTEGNFLDHDIDGHEGLTVALYNSNLHITPLTMEDNHPMYTIVRPYADLSKNMYDGNNFHELVSYWINGYPPDSSDNIQ
jgi:hypothetical protein